MTCCTLGNLEINKTLKSNRLKYHTSDTFKLLCHNSNHQQGFVKQKIVALNCCGFNLKFPKHYYCDNYFGYTLLMK